MEEIGIGREVEEWKKREEERIVNNGRKRKKVNKCERIKKVVRQGNERNKKGVMEGML